MFFNTVVHVLTLSETRTYRDFSPQQNIEIYSTTWLINAVENELVTGTILWFLKPLSILVEPGLCF